MARPFHVQIFGCAAPPVLNLWRLAEIIDRQGWTSSAIVTSEARKLFFERHPDGEKSWNALSNFTGGPVLTTYADALDHPRPPADALIVAPATVNSVIRASLGEQHEELGIGVLVEELGAHRSGSGKPLCIFPFTNRIHAGHANLRQVVKDLRDDYGVDIIFGEEEYPLSERGTGFQRATYFPWGLAVQSIAWQAGLEVRDLRECDVYTGTGRPAVDHLISLDDAQYEITSPMLEHGSGGASDAPPFPPDLVLPKFPSPLVFPGSLAGTQAPPQLPELTQMDDEVPILEVGEVSVLERDTFPDLET